MNKDNLLTNLQKSLFTKPDIKWLGYKFIRAGILPLQTKAAAILANLPQIHSSDNDHSLDLYIIIANQEQHCHPQRQLLKNLTTLSGLKLLNVNEKQFQLEIPSSRQIVKFHC